MTEQEGAALSELTLADEADCGPEPSMQLSTSAPVRPVHAWYRLAATPQSIRDQSHGSGLPVDDTATNRKTLPNSSVKYPIRPSAAARAPTVSRRSASSSQAFLCCWVIMPPPSGSSEPVASAG